MHQEHEFDKYLKNYRKNLDISLSLSGETSDFFAQYKAQKLAEWLPQLQTKKIEILDFGCGDGQMTAYVQQKFANAQVFGTDISHNSIAYATKKHPHISFSMTQNNTITYPANKFDLVYAAGVFHHIPLTEHQKFISQIMQVLKPGGYFVLFELNPYNPLTQKTFKQCPIDKKATMLSSRYAKNLLQPYGSVTTKYYFFFPSFLKKIRPIEKFLSRLPIGALYAIILKKS